MHALLISLKKIEYDIKWVSLGILDVSTLKNHRMNHKEF
jgi:hypothetical protein